MLWSVGIECVDQYIGVNDTRLNGHRCKGLAGEDRPRAEMPDRQFRFSGMS